MKSEFMIALTQLASERNLPKEVILKAVEAALISAFSRESFSGNQNISVKITPQTGEVKVYTQKMVLEDPTNPHLEMTLEEAQLIKKDARVGELIEIESTPQNAGRIAAQTAKQVVLQRLREAGRDVVYGEYVDWEGKLVSGVVERVDPRQVIVNLGRAEAILPPSEQMSAERYRVGQRLRLFLKEVLRMGRGPQLVVSRSHPELLRCLFDIEVPEIHSGIVEIKAVAREAGHRSKVAVWTTQEGIDPVGCCIGLRGTRIQNIIRELSGEKIDIVKWDPSPAVFVANALGPATVAHVNIGDTGKTATVIVPDKQLSLAIGKEGQNARLAAKLTGWRIDIKNSTMDEATLAIGAAPQPVAVPEAAPPPPPAPAPVPVPIPVPVVTEVRAHAPTEVTPAPAEVQAPAGDALLADFDRSIDRLFQEATQVDKGQLRFAEDLGRGGPFKGEPKKKKKAGKKVANKFAAEDEESDEHTDTFTEATDE